MAKILYYDASCGISGDMNLAALVGLGVDFDYLCSELEKLNLSGEFRLEQKNVVKSGIAATKIDVMLLKSQPHARSYADIKQILASSNLSEFCKKKAAAIFHVIAQAEAKVHAVSIDEVHFHEVGAVDSIVDVVGAAICLEYLYKNFNISRVLSSKIELGGGVVKCDHGTLNVPAPAVCEILKGVSVSLGRANFEMTTPTGAAILRACADGFVDEINFKIEKIAYGAGEKNTPNFANALRVMICEVDESQNLVQKMISTNIDDMDAESFAFACEILRENGALDVFSHSIYMKKGRIGFELNVLCRSEDAKMIKDLIFTHTTAIGVRELDIVKTELKRDFVSLTTKFGDIRLKISGSDEMQKVKPEFEECKSAALAHKTSIFQVKKEIFKKYDEARNSKK